MKKRMTSYGRGHQRLLSICYSLLFFAGTFVTHHVHAQCTQPQYVENGGYVAGSEVQVNGNKYQCKPWPYSGWCNGSAWAYAPGTGTYWTDAWTLIGPCGTLPNTPPAVSLTAPANNTNYSAPAAVTITANATDSDGTVSAVAFYNGATLLGTDNTAPYSFSWINVPAGSYAITARATDNSGATTTSSIVNIIVNAVPNTPPSVSITAPVNNASFSAPASVTITAIASDNDGTVSSVAFYNGSTLLTTDNSSPYSYSWTNVAAGSYTITVRATDNNGATTVSSAVNIVVNPAPATVATVYKDCNYGGYAVALPPGDYTTAQLIAKGILNNDISSFKINAGFEVVFYDGDNFTGTALVLSAENTCLVANSFNDLTSSLKVRTATSNQLPNVTFTAPANNTTFTAPASITLTANASDPDGTITQVEFFNGVTSLGIDNTNPYSVNWTNVAPGTYSLTAKAIDNRSGSSTSSVITVIVTSSVLVDITNLGGYMSAQFNDSPSAEGIAKLIDNQASTKFLTFNASTYVQLQQANASVVTKYTLTSANDADSRDPLNWILQGSNNGENWITLDTRSNEDFPTRLLKKEYTFTNTASYTYYRLQMSNNSGTILQLAEWELWGTGGGGNVLPTPPATWQEHWFDHNQVVSRVFYNDEVAIYYDNDMDRSVTWLNSYLTTAWVYSKQVYGQMSGGSPDNRMFAIFHANKYGGGHPSYYFEGSHDYRNVIDLGQNGSWANPVGWSLDATIHEIGHIVESTTNNGQGSPAFPLWGDSKWCEIYQYDLYLGVGWTADATRYYNSAMNTTDNYPRAGTQWFKNWFYPIWSNYGKSAVLSRFYQLMSQYFPKNGQTYSRNMNWGEFIHFWSGAAGVNLKPQATIAFGWPAEWETQFRKAQVDFPFTYTNASARLMDETEALSVWNSADGKTLTVNLPEVNTTEEANIMIYSATGEQRINVPASVVNNITSVDISMLQPGMYIIQLESEGQTIRQKIMIAY